jgi:hypothetical protein
MCIPGGAYEEENQATKEKNVNFESLLILLNEEEEEEEEKYPVDGVVQRSPG